MYSPTNAQTAYANDGLNRVTALSGTGATTVGYDANQNITTGLGVTYGYDTQNQLVTAGSASLTYDPTGRLYPSAGSLDRRFVYDGVQAIQVPTWRRCRSMPFQVAGDLATKLQAPALDVLIGHVHAALGEDFLDVAKAR